MKNKPVCRQNFANLLDFRQLPARRMKFRWAALFKLQTVPIQTPGSLHHPKFISYLMSHFLWFISLYYIHSIKKIKNMKEYLLLLRAGRPITSKTEAENKAEMKAWGAYMEDLGKKGQLGGGLPLVSEGAVVSAKNTSNDPVKSAKEGIIGGYLIVKADSLAKATEIAKACPHIDNEGNIEVREMAPMPAM
jgi:hypothetical protein